MQSKKQMKGRGKSMSTAVSSASTMNYSTVAKTKRKQHNFLSLFSVFFFFFRLRCPWLGAMGAKKRFCNVPVIVAFPLLLVNTEMRNVAVKTVAVLMDGGGGG